MNEVLCSLHPRLQFLAERSMGDSAVVGDIGLYLGSHRRYVVRIRNLAPSVVFNVASSCSIKSDAVYVQPNFV